MWPHRLLLENKQRISIPDIDDEFFAEPGFAEEIPVGAVTSPSLPHTHTHTHTLTHTLSLSHTNPDARKSS